MLSGNVSVWDSEIEMPYLDRHVIQKCHEITMQNVTIPCSTEQAKVSTMYYNDSCGCRIRHIISWVLHYHTHVSEMLANLD